jgi:hypothetical protein
MGPRQNPCDHLSALNFSALLLPEPVLCVGLRRAHRDSAAGLPVPIFVLAFVVFAFPVFVPVFVPIPVPVLVAISVDED